MSNSSDANSSQPTESGNKKSTLKKGALFTVFLVVLIDLMGFGIVLPLMPFFALEYNASPTMVGLLYAVYSLAQLVFSPIWGSLSDRVGRRPIMLLSTFGAVIAYILFGLAGSLGLLFISRLLAGIMGGNISTAQAYIADVTDNENRSSGMALIGVAFGVGFMIGPALGGLLISDTAIGFVQTVFNNPFGDYLAAHRYAVPGAFAAVLSLTSFLLVVFKLKETVDTKQKKAEAKQDKRRSILDPKFWAELKTLTKEPVLPIMLFGMFSQAFGQASLYSAFSLFCEKVWDMNATQVSQQFLFIGFVAIITQGGLIRPLTKRFSEVNLYTVGCVFMAIGLVLIPFMPSVWLLSAALTVLVFGNSLNTPTLTSLISKVAPEEQTGRILGTSQSISGLGRVLGPVWGGFAIGVNAPLAFWTTGLLVLTGLWVGLKIKKAKVSG